MHLIFRDIFYYPVNFTTASFMIRNKLIDHLHLQTQITLYFLLIPLVLFQACNSKHSEADSPKPLMFGNQEMAERYSNGQVSSAPDFSQYSHLKIPPLPPEETLDLFDLEDGFRIELVAHEPQIVDPVAMDIDANGRLWVAEMPSYMPVHDKSDSETSALERIPKSRIVILEDTNGDGVMDHSHIFMDGLVLPRAIKVLDNGVLIGEPPNVWFIRDTNGDGVGDTKELVYDLYGEPETDNVEHMPNGLMWGMDNWIHSVYSGVESLRYRNGEWETRAFEDLHQWGITQDDWGRIYSSHNTRTLTTHLAPYGYSERHPEFNLTTGIYENIAESETMWPAHPTGVNRGYRINNEVREDGTLKRSTSTTGPVIYRGDQFGEEYRGNAFVPEPAANLIKRFVGLDENPGEIETIARFAYREREFLTSTDERFRPVNMYNAPDGSLYVVDMYRGLFQHARFLTDFLRDYTVEHGLHEPGGLGKFGRIYRIVREDRDIDYNSPNLYHKTPAELTEYLKHRNGWYRDQAQQLLVQRSPEESTGLLEEFITDDSLEFYTRLQALWTLEGYDSQVYQSSSLVQFALSALDDDHPRIRASAIRILEPEIRNGNTDVLQALDQIIESESAPYVRLQLLASLGEADRPTTLDKVARLIGPHTDDRHFLEMTLTGIYQQELEFRNLLFREHNWEYGMSEESDWFLEQLDEYIIDEPEPDPVAHLTGEDLRLFNMGEHQYRACLACHGTRGQGQEGVAPPLEGSNWVTGNAGSLIRIMLQGFDSGENEWVQGSGGVMPGHDFMSDEELAAVLTYIRQSWNNDADPVSVEQVQAIRAATTEREDEWTPEELYQLEE
jgi:mono/diheme cytochrome c family protein/glucose/arabinose dehydrogenase